MSDVILGDCVTVMAAMDADSFDAIVTDPPYGLEFMGKEWDRLGAGLEKFTEADYGSVDGNSFGQPGGQHVRYGKSVKTMQAWHETWAREAYRVAKPGAHLLAFGGTRTYHRLTCALEDAGWEIRDCLVWAYASGFPKSLRVNSDPRFCQCAVRISSSERSDARTTSELSTDARTSTAHPSASPDEGALSPNAPRASRTRRGSRVGYPSGHGSGDGLLPQDEGGDLVSAPLPVGAPARSRSSVEGDGRPELEGTHTHPEHNGRPSTQDSRLRSIGLPCPDCSKPIADGLGTALKPAWEPIVLARKPLSGTVAQNVTKHGTGALNIDGTRIPGPKGDGVWGSSNATVNRERTFNASPTDEDYRTEQNAAGRWPPNLLLTDAALFDVRNDGVVGSGTVSERWFSAPRPRFFLVPKASRSDREPVWGEELTWGQQDEGRKKGNPGGDNPRNRGLTLRKNTHPTTKPVDLMRHLVRLVTPPGGRILDPFLGSGTTAIAAIMEGFTCVGIEREAEYVAIAEARLNGVQQGIGL